MSKKKYRIYKAGGAQQGSMMNPTAQFLARAQQGMQQPSEEEMAMMQQQAMQQQQGQPQMQQQGSQDQMMQQLVGMIGEALQNGAQPEEVVTKLLQDQVEPEMVAEALVELGMPPQEVNQLISSVMQGPQGGEEQMSEEEMMAMQQQQMAEDPAVEQAPMEAPMMSKGAFVKRKLRMAQEGMQQNVPSKSNTNLAAEDGVNNVAPILQFAKNNALKNQYEQEYNQMQNNQEMMPEARLGREARQERRQIRQDARTDRTEMRQDARTDRQAARLANRAVRQVSSPFGRVPGFSPYSPSPFMGGSMRLEDVERGLFGRLKNFKMSIDGLGFPSRFSEGMFINGLYNPYGMPGGQRRIVTRLQTPGEESFDEAGNTGGNTGGVSNPNPVPPPDGPVNPNDIEEEEEEVKKDIVDPKLKNEEDDDEKVDVLDTKKGDTSGQNNMTWSQKYGNVMAAVIGGYIVYRVVKGGRSIWVKRKAAKQKSGKIKVSGKEVAASPAEIKRAKNFSSMQKSTNPIATKYNSPAATAVRNHPINRPRTPGGQLQKYKAPNFKYPKVSPNLKLINAYGTPKVSWARRTARKIPFIGKKFGAPLLLGSYMYDNFYQDGGYIDSMDQNYGNPDLYKFTGGGNYDYFNNGGYVGYEDVTDPYMPSMEYGGYVPMANEGYQMGPDTVTGTDKDTFNEAYSSSADDEFENPTQELYQSLTPEQREMYKAEYQRRQQAGQAGQGGYGMMGYGQQPYRRGLFNTAMGINAPAAIQRSQYLTQMAGPTYADGTPVIGGALPEGYHLRTGSSKDGNAGIVYNTNNLRDRVFGRKDAAGNRVRVPKKTISYYFEGPNDTTPSLAGGDNAISNFKINPAPNVPEEASDVKGGSEKVKGRTVKGMTPLGGDKFIDKKGRLRAPGRVRGNRSSEEVNEPQAEQDYYYNFNSPAGPQNQQASANPSTYRNAFATGSLSRMKDQMSQGLEAERSRQYEQQQSSLGAAQNYLRSRQPAQMTTNNTFSSNKVNSVTGDNSGYIGSAKIGSNPMESFMNYDEGGESRRSNRKFAKEQLPLKNKISREARRDLRRGLNRDEITRDEYLEGVEQKASQMGPFNEQPESIYGNFNETLEQETAGSEYVESPDKLIDVSAEQLAENQKILDEQEAKAKAKSKKKVKKVFDLEKDDLVAKVIKGYDKLESGHLFGTDSRHSDFKDYDFISEEEMDELGIGTNTNDRMYNNDNYRRSLREDYRKGHMSAWGQKNVLTPRMDAVSDWARSQYDRINRNYRNGRIDKYTKKVLTNSIQGRQFDENQRIKDNYYDHYGEEIGMDKPTGYHNYGHTEFYDQRGDKTGEGEFYTAPKRSGSGGVQVGVDGTDAGGTYTWNEDGEKVYMKQYGGYQDGGYQEGEERYMTADEISQFMAAGGQIEFL